MKRVHVNFSCRLNQTLGIYGDCDCLQFDNADPEEVGYPPYHDGCMCFVIEEEGCICFVIEEDGK